MLGSRANVTDVTRMCAQLAGVEAAAVAPYETVDGTVQLIAYIVPSPGCQFDPGQLRDEARRRVPAHMVPSRFVELDALPLLGNGKLDRAKLLPPSVRPSPTESHRAPRGPVETMIAERWSRLLKTERVGVDDNFFEQGGHSLLALDLISEIREAFGVDVGISRLNDGPTVAALAGVVEQALINSRHCPTEPGQTGFTPLAHDAAHAFDPFPLTEMQQALWVGRTSAVEMGGIGCLGYFEWDCEGLSPDALERAWQALIDRHDALRTIFSSDGMQRTLGDTPPYRIERVDLRGFDAEQQTARLSALRETLSQSVLPADSWPLFRIAMCRLGDRGSRVMMGIDLLILDAWSYFHILIPELVRLLERRRGTSPAGIHLP